MWSSPFVTTCALVETNVAVPAFLYAFDSSVSFETSFRAFTVAIFRNIGATVARGFVAVFMEIILPVVRLTADQMNGCHAKMPFIMRIFA